MEDYKDIKRIETSVGNITNLSLLVKSDRTDVSRSRKSFTFLNFEIIITILTLVLYKISPTKFNVYRKATGTDAGFCLVEILNLVSST